MLRFHAFIRHVQSAMSMKFPKKIILNFSFLTDRLAHFTISQKKKNKIIVNTNNIYLQIGNYASHIQTQSDSFSDSSV